MRGRVSSVVLAALGLALIGSACASSKPKQAEEPDPLGGSGEDMAPGETAADKSKPDTGGEEQMHAKCCGECREAHSKDRSGQPADTIPCVDYSDLSPWCTEHFRGKPSMVTGCQ